MRIYWLVVTIRIRMVSKLFAYMLEYYIFLIMLFFCTLSPTRRKLLPSRMGSCTVSVAARDVQCTDRCAAVATDARLTAQHDDTADDQHGRRSCYQCGRIGYVHLAWIYWWTLRALACTQLSRQNIYKIFL